MNRFVLLLSAAALVGAASLPVLAAGQSSHKTPLLNFRGADQSRGMKGFFGTWLTTYDGGVHHSFMQWRSDGTATQNTDLSTLEGNVMSGEWTTAGRKSLSVSLICWDHDDSGNLSGWFVKKETDTLTKDGYSGNYEVTFYDLEGNVLLDHSGALTAARVAQ